MHHTLAHVGATHTFQYLSGLAFTTLLAGLSPWVLGVGWFSAHMLALACFCNRPVAFGESLALTQGSVRVRALKAY
jgi:hypothetical protein